VHSCRAAVKQLVMNMIRYPSHESTSGAGHECRQALEGKTVWSTQGRTELEKLRKTVIDSNHTEG
jgi:hypothetical protein